MALSQFFPLPTLIGWGRIFLLMPDKDTPIQKLKEKINQFISARDWEKFHSPKNLSMSIAIEAAELMEKFQWVEGIESKDLTRRLKQEIEEELADIAVYILNFCSLYGIDFSDAIERKLKINTKKYPVRKSRGVSLKYNKL